MALAGTACGGVFKFEASPDEGQSALTSSSAPVDGGQAAPDTASGAQQVTAQPGRAAVVMVPVDDVDASVENGHILVRPIWTGVDACHGLERVDVAPAPGGMFTITVWEGLDPGVDPAAPKCQKPASQRSTLVDLGAQPSGTYAVTGAGAEDSGGEAAGTAVEVEVP